MFDLNTYQKLTSRVISSNSNASVAPTNFAHTIMCKQIIPLLLKFPPIFFITHLVVHVISILVADLQTNSGPNLNS